MLAKRQGFPRKLGGCAGLDPRLRSAVSAGVGDGERGLRRGLRAPGVGVRRMWALEYSPSNKTIKYLFSITWVQAGLRTTHRFCGGDISFHSSTFLPRINSTLCSLWPTARCAPLEVVIEHILSENQRPDSHADVGVEADAWRAFEERTELAEQSSRHTTPSICHSAPAFPIAR